MFVPSSHHLRRVVVRPLLPCFGLFLRETDLYRVLYCCELSVTWKGVVGVFSRLRLEEFRVSYLDTVSSRKTRNRLGEHEDESHDVHLRLTLLARCECTCGQRGESAGELGADFTALLAPRRAPKCQFTHFFLLSWCPPEIQNSHRRRSPIGMTVCRHSHIPCAIDNTSLRRSHQVLVIHRVHAVHRSLKLFAIEQQ